MSAWILTSPQTNHKPANFSDPPFQNLGFKLVSPQQKQKRWGKVVCVCGGRGEGGVADTVEFSQTLQWEIWCVFVCVCVWVWGGGGGRGGGWYCGILQLDIWYLFFVFLFSICFFIKSVKNLVLFSLDFRNCI